MKNLIFLFFACLLIFPACQKETDVQPSLKEQTLNKVEYSKSELKTIFDVSKSEADNLEVGYPCRATVVITNVQEINSQNGYWKTRIHSNSWWPVTYYEFTEEGVYHITLPSNASLSLAFSATLYDWDCEDLPYEDDGESEICDYTVTADITFSSDFEQFSETFEAYTSSNYSSGMSYGFQTDNCGAVDR